MEGVADQCRAWCPHSAVLALKAPGGPFRVFNIAYQRYLMCRYLYFYIYTRACFQDIIMDFDVWTRAVRNKHCMIVRIVDRFYIQRACQGCSVCVSIGCIASIWTGLHVSSCLSYHERRMSYLGTFVLMQVCRCTAQYAGS